MKILVVFILIVILAFSITVIAHNSGLFREGWHNMWNTENTEEYNEPVSLNEVTVVEVSNKASLVLVKDATGTEYLLNFNAILPYLDEFRPYTGLTFSIEGIEMDFGFENLKGLFVVSVTTKESVFEIPERYLSWISGHVNEMNEHMGNNWVLPEFGIPCH